MRSPRRSRVLSFQSLTSPFHLILLMQSTAIRIAVVGFFTSLCFSFLVFPTLVEPQRINIDPDRFGQLAANIAQGNGFVYEKDGPPVLERTPLYALILAGLFKLVGGYSLQTVQVLQAILHGISSFIIYVIGVRLCERRAAIFAQLLFTFHPIVVWYTARIWVETTQTLILLLVALAMVRLFDMPSVRRALFLGVCMGLGSLTKSTLMLFPFVTLTLLFYRFKDEGLKFGVIILVAAFLVVLPWSLRNYQVTAKFLSVNTSLGFNLIQGDIIGEQWPSFSMTTVEGWSVGKQRVDSVLNSSGDSWESVKGDRTLTAYAVRNYTRHPFAFVWRCVANLFTFWYLSESAVKSLVFGLLQISLVLLAALSFIKMNSPGKKSFLPFIVLCGYLFLVNGLVVGWGRYSMPMIPFLLLIASPLLQTILPQRNETRS